MAGALAAQTGLLDATKRHMLGGQDAHVNTHHAVFQGIRNMAAHLVDRRVFNQLALHHASVKAITAARDNKMAELVKLGQQCSVKLDEQDESQRTGKKNKSKGRPMSDSGTKARFYHAVKDAHMAHVIKFDLTAALFSYPIDEEKKR